MKTFNIDPTHPSYYAMEELVKTELVLTVDGVFDRGTFVGSSFITSDKVYRPIKYVKIGNWFDWISYYYHNKEKCDSIIKNFVIDFDPMIEGYNYGFCLGVIENKDGRKIFAKFDHDEYVKEQLINYIEENKRSMEYGI